MYNSPWNIAANFNVDMSFSPREIATMLTEYETDHQTGMDIDLIAEEIYSYTSGYPFLVSRICKCIDEEMEDKNWTSAGVQNAVAVLLAEKNTLFDDLAKNLENNPDVYEFLYALLIAGENKTFNRDIPVVDQRRMDIIVDFGREQFIVELKLWKGEAGMDKAYEQLHGYMQSKGAKHGYLLTFDFRKQKEDKEPEWVQIEDSQIFSVVV
jgi:hypothetical protein